MPDSRSTSRAQRTAGLRRTRSTGISAFVLDPQIFAAERLSGVQAAYRDATARISDSEIPWVMCWYPTPALAQDAQGYVWVDGPMRYDGRTWQKVEVPGETGPVQCWSMLGASDGSLWLGRTEGGLLHLRNGVWTRIAPGSGLPAGLVNALVEGSPGTVWAGTSGGLARYIAEQSTAKSGAAGGLARLRRTGEVHE